MKYNDRKNNILFILEALGAGGTATSMINLLSLLKEHYGMECDILLFRKDGIFTQKAEERFSILDENPFLWFLSKGKKAAFRERPVFALFMLAAYQTLSFVLRKRYRAKYFLYKRIAKKYSNRYQYVIGYQEEGVTAFASHIQAEHKIAWLHNSISNLPQRLIGFDYIRNIYNRFETIVCVSNETRRDFIQHFPALEKKTLTIYNSFPVDEIRKKSKETIIARPNTRTVFLSVGRFTKQKRFDKIIEIARRLRENANDFVWYLVGDGELFKDIDAEIDKYGLNEYVRLTGRKENPFPYYIVADYLVITSDYEAHPMVVNESLVLDTPVISTNFPSINEIVKQKTNGLIANGMEAADLANALIELLADADLQKTIKRGARETEYNNHEILSQVHTLLCG